MKPVLIVRHEHWIEAGRIGETLDREGLPRQLCAIDRGDAVPTEPDDYAGLVFLGGTMSVNDGFSWIDAEVALIRRAIEREVPVLGHCLGSQLCALALDTAVHEMPAKEIGWHRIRRTPGAAAGEWLGSGPDECDILIWHHDAFDLPPGTESLYSSDYCPDQAFAIGSLVATAAHVEVTADLLRRWIDIYGHDLDPVSETVQPPEQILIDVGHRVAAMQRNVTDPIYRCWLRHVRERIESRASSAIRS